jgi:hypothetical protein
VCALGYVPVVRSPSLEPLFGTLSPESAAAVLTELVNADAAIARIGGALGTDAQQHYENEDTGNRLGLMTHPRYTPMIDGCLSASQRIDNEDGTTSHGNADLCFSIDFASADPSEPRRWRVKTRVSVNCDRRHCPDDPHDLVVMVGETASPTDAVALLSKQIDELRRWLDSRENQPWQIFRHTD